MERALATLLGLAVPLVAQLGTCLRINRSRLRYDDLFWQRGLLCGSGPIEDACCTLRQVRLKRNGQHWSNDGLDRLAHLRSALKSPWRHLLINLFKNPPV